MKLKPETNYVIEGEVQINPFKNEDEEAQFVVDKIIELTKLKNHKDIEGTIDYSKITVLARNKYVFQNLHNKLEEVKIPFYYKSGNQGIKFTSNEMIIFDLYFRIKVNSKDKIHLDRLKSLLKVDNVYSEKELLNSKYPISKEIVKLFKDISLENFHLKIKQFSNLIELNDDDSRKLIIDEINELEEQLNNYKKQNTNKRTLNGFKSAMALGTVNKQQTDNGVCLSTVHTMKGQENEIIFLIGMDDGTFPDFRAKIPKEVEQEKNNLYVAFTRAKRLLYISYPKNKTMPWGVTKPRKISRFLENLL